MMSESYTYASQEEARGINVSANVTGNCSVVVDQRHGRTLDQELWTYTAPLILCIGAIGNALILLVMGRRRMRGTTTSVYLRLMALGDLCVLITGIIPEWLEATNLLVFKELHPVTCKLEKFLFYTCGDTAIWILVIFTIDRFIAIAFPLSKKEMCLYWRAKLYCFVTLTTAASKNAHVFWTRGAEYAFSDTGSVVLVRNCGRPTHAYKQFEKFVRPWIAFTLVSAVPFAILLFCNIWIIKVLIQVKRMRFTGESRQRHKDRTLIQMTTMCLSASFCFLVCITPSIVLLIGKPYWAGNYDRNAAYAIAKSISNQLVYVNHSVNFFLYCLTGRRFRQELALFCTRKDSHYGVPVSTMDSRATIYRFTTNMIRANPKGGIGTPACIASGKLGSGSGGETGGQRKYEIVSLQRIRRDSHL